MQVELVVMIKNLHTATKLENIFLNLREFCSVVPLWRVIIKIKMI